MREVYGIRVERYDIGQDFLLNNLFYLRRDAEDHMEDYAYHQMLDSERATINHPYGIVVKNSRGVIIMRFTIVTFIVN